MSSGWIIDRCLWDIVTGPVELIKLEWQFKPSAAHMCHLSPLLPVGAMV